ncbi:DUF1178 family protein [Glaciimonas sp. PAMC28666]|uniref:DUF1178 family protein n=1 Tax=Glaciimonas sp. PAMC28666 TaxID=2807626 RepID=UPI001964208A|nr:DUF1178 family protein [Glaciimonas sp. PAMC28666]QRX82920.1 DUF1178 family protein [Glaciimonas sp. PAMC28666]
MKVYNLGCDQQHRFEGWFASEQDFLSQSDQHQIVCPTCDSPHVRKLPSAPHLNISHLAASAAAAAPSAVSHDAPSAMAVRQETAMAEMARYVLKNTKDVGERFTEEARRMHYKEVPNHAIRGVASPAQREELAEEGIDVVELALPARFTESLQ